MSSDIFHIERVTGENRRWSSLFSNDDTVANNTLLPLYLHFVPHEDDGDLGRVLT
jgi:hypothetical protein